jgi:hypothetical protein
LLSHILNGGYGATTAKSAIEAYRPIRAETGRSDARGLTGPLARLTVRQAVAEKQEATGARVALLAINLEARHSN